MFKNPTKALQLIAEADDAEFLRSLKVEAERRLKVSNARVEKIRKHAAEAEARQASNREILQGIFRQMDALELQARKAGMDAIDVSLNSEPDFVLDDSMLVEAPIIQFDMTATQEIK